MKPLLSNAFSFLNAARRHVPRDRVLRVRQQQGEVRQPTQAAVEGVPAEVQAAEKELRRLQQIKALEGAAGTWKDKDHPELKGGVSRWVRELRKENERRLHKTANR